MLAHKLRVSKAHGLYFCGTNGIKMLSQFRKVEALKRISPIEWRWGVMLTLVKDCGIVYGIEPILVRIQLLDELFRFLTYQLRLVTVKRVLMRQVLPKHATSQR